MREAEYIHETALAYRKEYGQFFTPPPVAKLMAQWVMKHHPNTILDPAFGLGVFYDEIVTRDAGNTVYFTGYEIDQHIIAYLNHNGHHQHFNLVHGDYLEADIEGFDGIICNPPYMRFQKFLQRHDVLPKIEEKIGKKLIGYANISSIFLVKSLQELNANGHLAFIMPFEFFNTGYGETIKKTLIERHILKQIILFSNEKEIFPEAITTVCVLLCKNDATETPIKITRITANEELERISDISAFYQREISARDLPCDKKWTPLLLSLFSEPMPLQGFCPLSFYGTFMRGIATGANDFFALTKSTIEYYRLDEQNICKCVTKSPQIRSVVFTDDDFQRLYDADKPVYCLDVKDHEKQEIRAYIAEGEKREYHKRFLTKTRNIWYKIEHRTPAPILFGVFNRGRSKVVRNFTTAIHFTCFHGFYPNMFGAPLINKLFVYLLSDVGQNIIKTNKRSYGDDLDKFEPGDLNECLCPGQYQFSMIDEKEAVTIINIAKTDERLAIRMSNDLISRVMNIKQSLVAKL